MKIAKAKRLPPHVIRMIASMVHQDVLEERQITSEDIVVSDHVTFAFEPSVFKTGAEFPYNMVRVCRSWWNALRRVPHFWTDFHINITTDPARMLRCLSWSEGLPLSVCITTTKESPVDTLSSVPQRVAEKRRVETVIDALQPHLWRCTSIAIRVNWDSNLPSLDRLILPDSTELRILICQCRLIKSILPYEGKGSLYHFWTDHNGWSNDQVTHTPGIPLCSYAYPMGEATAMAITGRQYADAVLHSPGLFESMARRVDHLAISYFLFVAPKFGPLDLIDRAQTERHLTVHGFFDLLSTLRKTEDPALGLYLYFMTPADNLSFTSKNRIMRYGKQEHIISPASFNYISFTSVHKSIINEIQHFNGLSLRSTTFLRFRNCVLGGPFSIIGTIYGVVLEEIDDPCSVAYIVTYLRYTASVFRACAGLIKGSADFVSGSRFWETAFPLEKRDRDLAETMRGELYIVDCEGLSDEGMKILVMGYALQEDGENLLRTVVHRSRGEKVMSREVVEWLGSLRGVCVDFGVDWE